MTTQAMHSVLLIGEDHATFAIDPESAEISTAKSAREALHMLRFSHFDLLVICDRLPDMSAGDLASAVRAICPWQSWALVDRDVGPQEEIRARELGAVAVIDETPHPRLLLELAAASRRKTTRQRVTSVADADFAELQPAQL